jgi:hypothetical protein
MRGFSRVGIGCAIVAAICGVGITAISVTTIDAGRENWEFDKYACLLRSNRNFALASTQYKALADASNCGYFAKYDTYSSLSWVRVGDAIERNGYLLERVTDSEITSRRLNAALIGLGVTLAFCAVVFGFFRGLGWVVAGFVRD